MANNRLSELTISFVKRNARAKGPTSSESWNDSFDELSRDLNSIYNEWNNSLIPLLSLLPHNDLGLNIDAYTSGLDGRTLYVNAEATADNAVNYYNAGQTRANTIYEQFQSVYSYIETKVNTVQDQIDNVALSAADIPIADSGAVFSSGTVEGALQEVMNLVARTGTDHGSLLGLTDDDHTLYLPRTGVRAMTGDLNLGNHNIDNVNQMNVNTLTLSTLNTSGLSIIGGGLITVTSGSMTLTNGAFSAAQIRAGTIASTRRTTALVLASTDGGTLYHNIGASSLVNFTLFAGNSSTRGCTFYFVVGDADGIRVTAPPSQRLYINGVASSIGGTATCTTLGASLTMTYIDNDISTAGVWMALAHEGTWTIT
jgi:hypothetical protein